MKAICGIAGLNLNGMGIETTNSGQKDFRFYNPRNQTSDEFKLLCQPVSTETTWNDHRVLHRICDGLRGILPDLIQSISLFIRLFLHFHDPA
jgi:hypothetical protein